MQEDLITRVRTTLASVLVETAERCGGIVREERGLLLVAGNHPCPVLVNSALRTGAMDAAEVLQRAQAFFGPLGRGWETWVGVGHDADLQQEAEKCGLSAAPELVGMVLTSRPAISQVTEVANDVEFCWVHDMAGVHDFACVAAEGLREEAPGLSELIHATFSDRQSLVASDTAAFVVRYRGEPVATALTIVKDKVAWIGWVATRPRFRCRGFGRLATLAAVTAGFTLGATLASLEATMMGVPVYSKLGFREVVRYRNYWPGGFARSLSTCLA